jgi:hypothetical protein
VRARCYDDIDVLNLSGDANQIDESPLGGLGMGGIQVNKRWTHGLLHARIHIPTILA